MTKRPTEIDLMDSLKGHGTNNREEEADCEAARLRDCEAVRL